MRANMRRLLNRLTDNLNDATGRALCSVAETPPSPDAFEPRARLQRFLEDTYGLTVSTDCLQELTREDAIWIAADLLLGPIFGDRPDDKSEAQNLALEFVAQFTEDVSFYSTYSYHVDRTQDAYIAIGVALLDNSYDMGILAVDSNRVGILWVGDED